MTGRGGRGRGWRRVAAGLALVAAALAAPAGASHGAESAPIGVAHAAPVGATAAASAGVTDPGGYVGVAPARILDTRVGSGAVGPVSPWGIVHVPVAGAGGIPTTGVSSVVLNVTVTAPTAPGWITAAPDGTTIRDASALNFVTGQTVPGSVVVKLGDNGQVALVNGSPGTVHLLADVAGYYLDGIPTQPGAFVSLPANRVVDTRTGQGGASTLPPGGSIDVPMLGVGGVPPSGVSAVVLTVTATNPTRPGWVGVYPVGGPAPTVSNLNVAAGQTVANLVVVKVGSAGRIALVNGSEGTVDLVGDVAGYVLDGTVTRPGMFVAHDPSRILDTRDDVGAPGPVLPGGRARLAVPGAGGVPSTGVAAVVLNVTAVSPGGTGWVTAYPDWAPVPTASTLNVTPGRTVANLAFATLGPHETVALSNSSTGTMQLVGDVAGYVVAAPPPTTPPVRVAAVGDIGSTDRASAVLGDIGAAHPDLSLFVGDLSYGVTGRESTWCDFVTARVGATQPVELVAGNHESNGLNGRIDAFAACLPNRLPGLVGSYGRQYLVDYPATNPVVRFVMISPGLTFPDGTWSYAAGTPRYDWTRTAIVSARQAGIPWVVVGMHKPCLDSGIYACDIGADLQHLLVAHRVDLVVAGHDHSYQRTAQLGTGPACPTIRIGGFDPSCVAGAGPSVSHGAGTVFVTAATGGAELYPVRVTDPEAPYFRALMGANTTPTWGWLGLSISANRLEATFQGSYGSTFGDSVTITRP